MMPAKVDPTQWRAGVSRSVMAPSFAGLSAALRTVALARIRARVLTGRMLGRRCLISQPHVSNWLAGRRKLSPAACDAVLAAMRLSAAAVLAGEVPAPVPYRAAVVVMPGPGDPRRVPAVAAHVCPPWRRRAGLQAVS
jgi:DNA-binding transcriptional regulator YdaS (Cro superfamily)